MKLPRGAQGIDARFCASGDNTGDAAGDFGAVECFVKRTVLAKEYDSFKSLLDAVVIKWAACHLKVTCHLIPTL